MHSETGGRTPCALSARRAHSVRVSTPGRICLFGEHQDYLQLPVIPCAISLRIFVEGQHNPDPTVILDLPDIDSEDSFPLQDAAEYRDERDYFRSAINVMRREGFTFSQGVRCTVHGDIPINSGTSSSSALVVTWVNFLARMSDQHRDLDAMLCARLAHAAEVVEFHEPGGMMDHYSTACGGVISLEFFPEMKIERMPATLGRFVLGDSRQPKDTKGILARVKNQVLAATGILREKVPQFSLHTVRSEELDQFRHLLTPQQLTLLEGTVRNRDITAQAKQELRKNPVDHRKIGALLTEHQSILRDVLKISTPKIDTMLAAAMAAGAYGGKINGSGGGGCMFAYAPENAEVVAQAIEEAEGRAYIVSSDQGTRAELTGDDA